MDIGRWGHVDRNVRHGDKKEGHEYRKVRHRDR